KTRFGRMVVGLLLMSMTLALSVPAYAGRGGFGGGGMGMSGGSFGGGGMSGGGCCWGGGMGGGMGRGGGLGREVVWVWEGARGCGLLRGGGGGLRRGVCGGVTFFPRRHFWGPRRRGEGFFPPCFCLGGGLGPPFLLLPAPDRWSPAVPLHAVPVRPVCARHRCV